jgi:hypothetical protein
VTTSPGDGRTEPGPTVAAAQSGDLDRLFAQIRQEKGALEVSQFHVADAATILRIDPIALLYVATVLAQRLDSANRGLLELKRQVLAAVQPRVGSLEAGCVTHVTLNRIIDATRA